MLREYKQQCVSSVTTCIHIIGRLKLKQKINSLKEINVPITLGLLAVLSDNAYTLA